MKIGLWNIDHPEVGSGNEREEKRFGDVAEYLRRADCDAFIITEANAALQIPGYSFELSAESPFKSSRRFYGPPNTYHQVAIYSRIPLIRTEVVEPINGLQGTLRDNGHTLELYGNVITIKDQWSKTSKLTYSDRLDEQLYAIQRIPQQSALIAGDFNLSLGWRQFAHKRVREDLAANGWVWPTENRDDTVQHVLHTWDLNVDLTLDFGVKYGQGRKTGLSDHPFVGISVFRRE